MSNDIPDRGRSCAARVQEDAGKVGALEAVTRRVEPHKAVA